VTEGLQQVALVPPHVANHLLKLIRPPIRIKKNYVDQSEFRLKSLVHIANHLLKLIRPPIRIRIKILPTNQN
jgi:hypothetical protein